MKDEKHVSSFRKVSPELGARLASFLSRQRSPALLLTLRGEPGREVGSAPLCALQWCLGTDALGAICHVQL